MAFFTFFTFCHFFRRKKRIFSTPKSLFSQSEKSEKKVYF